MSLCEQADELKTQPSHRAPQQPRIKEVASGSTNLGNIHIHTGDSQADKTSLLRSATRLVNISTTGRATSKNYATFHHR